MTPADVEFDPFSDEYFNDPTEVYRRLRDEAPVYFSERYGFYALSRFADVVAAHRDWEGSRARTASTSRRSEGPGADQRFRMIIMMDPPEHDRLRALVSRVFTPRAVDRARADDPRGHRRRSSTPLGRRDEFDAVADFSAPFPVEIISRMLGVPEGERQQIRDWLDLSLHREPGLDGPDARGHRGHASRSACTSTSSRPRSARTRATT